MQKITGSVYRSFLRISKGLLKGNNEIYLQHRLDPQAEVSWLYFDSAGINSAVINNMLTWPSKVREAVVPELEKGQTRWINGLLLKTLIKKAFKIPISKAEVNEHVDFAFDALREINLLQKLSLQTSVTRDPRGVIITCTSLYSEEDSHLKFAHYTHFYRITIENQGDTPVRLMARTWTFKADGAAPIILPRWAPGVVGEQPLLGKGEGFHYMSSTRISAESGYMEGIFQFSDASGALFEVPISRCALTKAKFSR